MYFTLKQNKQTEINIAKKLVTLNPIISGLLLSVPHQNVSFLRAVKVCKLVLKDQIGCVDIFQLHKASIIVGAECSYSYLKQTNSEHLVTLSTWYHFYEKN